MAAVVVGTVLALAAVPQVAAADAETTAAEAPTTSTPPSVDGVGVPRSALRGEGGVSAAEFGFVFLGRPGSVAAGFDRYYWMTAAGLGVRSACSGSHTSAGHCTWAEYFWGRTGTSGGSYLSGDAVPMYFDWRSRTVWLMFGPEAAVESGVWSGTQGSLSATVAVTCASHDSFRIDDWPPSDRHDDVWHDVTVCEATLPDMAEADGTASIPLRPDDFEVRVLDGSDSISRAGQITELVLELRRPAGVVYRRGAEPIPATVPAASTPIGIAVTHGPSAGAAVMCLVPPADGAAAPGYSSRCVTDARGRVTTRYLVPADAAHASRRVRDTLLIFEDRDGDTAHDHRPGRAGHEPAAAIDIPVAKRVNYVALGDSYSSGEAGRPDAADFMGSYQSSTSPADPHCRRWSEAYSSVIARGFLSSAASEDGVDFVTFACTGAVTRNVYDPRSPGGGVTQDDLIGTNRPSHAAPSLRYDPDTNRLLPAPGDWEPRQAASLTAVQSMTDIDMITITIGGNDVGFGDVVRACATPLFGNLDSTCNQDDLALDWAQVQDRIKDALVRIRTTAPQASVYVLGYPPITPRPAPCPADVRDCPELGINSLIDDCPALSAADIIRHTVDRDQIPFPLRVGSAFSGIPLGPIADLIGATLAGTAPGVAKIDHVEAAFLWSSATALNSAIRDAATAAGVHFVDVAGTDGSRTDDAMFAMHDPCDNEPWLHGFVLDRSKKAAASDASFHPTRAGHIGYARILERYVRGLVSEGYELTEAGLPANPEPASR